jgi:apolipoprotein N-acyltransferase
MLHFFSMRLISGRAWALVVLSASLQIFMFPTAGPMPLWRAALCWIALVPFLVALTTRDRNGEVIGWRSAAWLGYLCGILWFFGNCFWIYQTMYLYGGLPKPVSFGIVILFSLYLGLYHALFASLFALVQRGRAGVAGALLLTPFLWVAVELGRARITGFPWDLLGNAQVDNLLVTRLAPLAGVMGISFVVAAVNAGMASFVVSSARRWVVPCVALVLAVTLQLCGGLKGLKNADRESLTHFAVMMQENLAVGAEGREVKALSQAQEMEEFSAESLRQFPVAGGVKVSPDQLAVIIWPEAPSHFQSNDPYFRTNLGALALKARVPVIAGSLGVDAANEASRGYFLYDSATVFTAEGAYKGRYDKIHLVPWGEYVPFKRLFSFAQKLTEGVGDMDPGRERLVFELGGHSYGIFVCYESIFGDEVRKFVQNGAQVLVNISDDGWYGDTGAPWQHLNMARMRAIENHRWVLRSTNTGVTTAIDPRGRVAVEAPRHVREAFAFPFAFEEGTTLYTRFGDWFAWLCVLVTTVCVAFSLKPRLALK